MTPKLGRLVRWLKHVVTAQGSASPFSRGVRRRRLVIAISRGALVSLAAVGIIGFLLLLLGPIAQWATVAAETLRQREDRCG
jgi:hypothetical protein